MAGVEGGSLETDSTVGGLGLTVETVGGCNSFSEICEHFCWMLRPLISMLVL